MWKRNYVGLWSSALPMSCLMNCFINLLIVIFLWYKPLVVQSPLWCRPPCDASPLVVQPLMRVPMQPMLKSGPNLRCMKISYTECCKFVQCDWIIFECCFEINLIDPTWNLKYMYRKCVYTMSESYVFQVTIIQLHNDRIFQNILYNFARVSDCHKNFHLNFVFQFLSGCWLHSVDIFFEITPKKKMQSY